ncbi:MAG TPA: 2OG-Fe(II) oxygenase [Pseudobdellovibrionaceae bacterium]|nr:2OG-Fe(II) oxygenase [Pseudobdellovibrionaceae bacterium]
MNYTLLTEQLQNQSYFLWPEFLSKGEVIDLKKDLLEIRNQSGFHRAKIGKKNEEYIEDEIRKDEIYWLNVENANSAQRILWNKLEQIQLALNRNLFLGLNQFEGHYAIYPPGGFYKKHLDSFRSDNARKVTIIFYLNENWAPENGGQLRIYKDKKNDKDNNNNCEYFDVNPQAGTLICFLSGELEHEVLLSHNFRYSFTGWFKSK